MKRRGTPRRDSTDMLSGSVRMGGRERTLGPGGGMRDVVTLQGDGGIGGEELSVFRARPDSLKTSVGA